jgi:hypothetical protein
MKIQPLSEDGKSIMLSGKIDGGYTVLPGVKITINKGSTFEGLVIDSSKTFWNQGQYVSQQFKLNSSGQIQLIPIPMDDGSRTPTPCPFEYSYKGKKEAWGEDGKVKIPSANSPDYSDYDSLTPDPNYPIPPDVDQHTELELSGDAREPFWGDECCSVS